MIRHSVILQKLCKEYLEKHGEIFFNYLFQICDDENGISFEDNIFDAFLSGAHLSKFFNEKSDIVYVSFENDFDLHGKKTFFVFVIPEKEIIEKINFFEK